MIVVNAYPSGLLRSRPGLLRSRPPALAHSCRDIAASSANVIRVRTNAVGWLSKVWESHLRASLGLTPGIQLADAPLKAWALHARPLN